VSADVYSFSIILFELFSGLNPFPGNMVKIYQQKLINPQPKIPDSFPIDLKDLVGRGCSKDPSNRPGLEEFNTAFHKMLKGDRKEHSILSCITKNGFGFILK
jgi:serine/threonine protein kinase